ncbi:protein-tyrosine phosphatase family protein [Chromobacterium violaceum]|uniref:protein-tyrosine-phosphatase n=1 Tax=Chromobacterium violaceum (strain ATCC 12472 / DSM 30191 / JCM 1249 / CCUG 213 / NBRC 12614 / NCIMB 9131 / NCTC 9757 / MK) TaxID=243365 RepID=Q7NZE8_CHRVO|nr:protein-tyrosine phosphatase family protein [Chromobacterium violaceum]AAQ58648.1 probable tyrosine phosphatase [Chromobacterium violaceum ATCC 12472]SUX39781.1 Tyrosine-protein phosphatase yopH [Chromobacterium violaceum]
MSTIQTGIQLGGRQLDLSRLDSLSGVNADKARIGIRKDGTLVVYTGRSYLLHPDQTRRADQFLLKHDLLIPGQKPREFRLAQLFDRPMDALTQRNTQANETIAKPTQQDVDTVTRGGKPKLRWADQAAARPSGEPSRGERASLKQRRGAEHLKLAQPRAEARPEKHDAIKTELASRLGSSDQPSGLLLQLKAQVGSSAEGARFLNDVGQARFRDIPTAAATQVRAPDGAPLPANRVQVGGVNVAIASQYPKAAQLESYFGMLAANRTPVLVVLASDADMAKQGRDGKADLPDYFSQSGRYGRVEVESKSKGSTTLEGGLEVRAYHLNVRGADHKSVSIPVLHVPNWADFGAQGATALKALAQHVDAVADKKTAFYRDNNSSALNDPDKLLPVIHCRAGVGRTGQLIAARELLKPGASSLESIVADMRGSRNHLMVQTSGQLSTLVDLAQQQGRAILQPETAAEPIYANQAQAEPIYANDAPPPPPRRPR